MVNRLVSVGDDFNLPDAVNVVDGNLPDRLQDAALSATYGPDASGMVTAFGSATQAASDPLRAAFMKKVERVRPLGLTKTLEDIGSHPGFPYAVNAPDGNLVVAWRVGTNHAPSKGVIKVARYTQAGAVIQAPTTVTTEAVYDARDSGLTVLADGRLAMTYFAWDVSAQAAILDGMRVMFSSDNGVTWTAAAGVDSAFTTWAAGAGAIVQLANGNLLLPTYGVSAGQFYQHAHVSRSTDNGVTWAPLAVIANGDTQGGRHYQEPNIILTDKGDLLALIRSDQALAHYSSRSSDGGVTWSTPVLAFAGSGSPRITNHAGFLHVVYRDEASGRTVKISSGDSGVTWGPKLVLPMTTGYGISSYGIAVPYGKESLRYIFAMQQSGVANNLATGVLLQVDAIVPEDRTAPGPITCRVKNTGTFAINTASWTTVTFSAEDHDTGDMHSTATNTSRITAPVAGYYSIKATVYFAASAAVQVQTRVLKNGVTTQPTGLRDKKNPVSGQDSLVTATGTLYLNAGDYLEVQGYQDSGGTISIRWEDTVFEMTLLSSPI